MRYLLSISIGPVQDFIATARRSRDLWFGSWLLSELSKSAAHVIVNEHKKESLIFPAIEDPNDLNEDSDFNVVNKIVALVDDPKTICEAIKKAMGDRLARIRKGAFDHVSGPFSEGIAIEQVKDLTEFYWAAAELDDPNDSSQYKAARDSAESLLAARKSTRNFKQVLRARGGGVASAMEWADYVPKSSLDGQREAVIHEDVYQAVKDGQMTKEDLRLKYGVREGERLCGVGLLKRHGNRAGDDSFFSTSHVAALPLLQSVDNAKYKSKFDGYVRSLETSGLSRQNGLNFIPLYRHTTGHKAFGRYDGHLLFSNRLADYIEDETKLQKAREALCVLLKEQLDVSDPLPYYALLLGDGDGMGKAIDAQDGIGKHQALSTQLTQFAKHVQHIVEVHSGSLVYAGGDDVLAFMPLHTVLDCARTLAKDFEGRMSSPQKFTDTHGNTPTLSVGIAVVHHLEPLSDALELARRAEKLAKRVPGKNALAVIVSKRSGADCEVAGQRESIDRRLKRFIRLHRMEAVPDGAAFELRELAIHLRDLPEAMMDDAVRILRRKRAAKGTEKMAEAVLTELEGYVRSEAVSIRELADELIVARLFASATKQADGLTPEQYARKPETEIGEEQAKG